MADGFGAQLGGFAREHRSAIIYSAFGAAVFIASLAATFPYAATLTALLRPLSLGFSSSSQGINLPLGAALSDVRVVSLQPSSPFEIESPDVTLAPALGALLLGEPGVRVHAQLYGGALRATVYRKGAETGVSFKLSDMGLARMAALRVFGGNVLGRISGGGWAELASNDTAATTGEFNFRTADFTIQVAEGFAPIRLGKVVGSLKLARGGALRVSKLSGHGPDGAIQGQGTIRLGPDARQSRINFALTIEPSAEGRKRLGVLFGLLPHPPDARAYLLSGPLLTPSIS
ncbi:MAG: type II secretion system protein GspN [Candidatus Binataceae bacterium]